MAARYWTIENHERLPHEPTRFFSGPLDIIRSKSTWALSLSLTADRYDLPGQLMTRHNRRVAGRMQERCIYIYIHSEHRIPTSIAVPKSARSGSSIRSRCLKCAHGFEILRDVDTNHLWCINLFMATRNHWAIDHHLWIWECFVGFTKRINPFSMVDLTDEFGSVAKVECAPQSSWIPFW